MSRTPNPLPRELCPGVFWLGECLVVPFAGKVFHSYNSVFLVVGDRHSALVETGLPVERLAIAEQLERVLVENGLPEPRYVFATHSEMAHASGVGHLLARFHEATVHGDISDLHLVFPQFENRLHVAELGDRFDLGGTEIVVVECVFRDLVRSRWFFDTRRRALFPGDGFAYSHYHEDGACGCLAEEVPSLDIKDGVARFAMLAFHWTQYVDVEPYIERLDALVFNELRAELIAPTHGLPIADPQRTMPAIRAGLRTIVADETADVTDAAAFRGAV